MTLLVNLEKYLISLGIKVDNTMFKEKSVYFRNALVRSNYFNNELHSKDLIIKELFNKEESN